LPPSWTSINVTNKDVDKLSNEGNLKDMIKLMSKKKRMKLGINKYSRHRKCPKTRSDYFYGTNDK
jgi:hypothetical protein